MCSGNACDATAHYPAEVLVTVPLLLFPASGERPLQGRADIFVRHSLRVAATAGISHTSNQPCCHSRKDGPLK